MYLRRLTVFSCISAFLILALPLANVGTRLQLDNVSPLPSEISALWSVDSAEGLLALALWKCCDRSLFPERIVIGQQGVLFLGNHYAKALDRSTGAYLHPPDKVEPWTDHIAEIDKWLAARDIPFLFVVAPSKHSIYVDYLPEGVQIGEVTDTDTFVAAAQKRDVPVLDARALQRRLAQTHHAYRITDTHWTNLGAAKTYEAALAAFEVDGLKIKPVPMDPKEISRGPGDLARIMKTSNLLPADIDIDYDLSLSDMDFCRDSFPYLAAVPEQCEPSEIDRPSGPEIEVIKSPDARNPETAVLLCDSNCVAQMDLYRRTFQTVYRLRWEHADDYNLFEQFKLLQPDLVILQFGERNIYEVQFKLD